VAFGITAALWVGVIWATTAMLRWIW